MLNVTRAINKAKKTYFQLYTHLFKLPFTTRRESKPNQVVNGSTTAFMLECLHVCACSWFNLEANAVVKASRRHCVKSLVTEEVCSWQSWTLFLHRFPVNDVVDLGKVTSWAPLCPKFPFGFFKGCISIPARRLWEYKNYSRNSPFLLVFWW